MFNIQSFNAIRRKINQIELSSGQWFFLLYALGLLALTFAVYLLKFAIKFL